MRNLAHDFAAVRESLFAQQGTCDEEVVHAGHLVQHYLGRLVVVGAGGLHVRILRRCRSW